VTLEMVLSASLPLLSLTSHTLPHPTSLDRRASQFLRLVRKTRLRPASAPKHSIASTPKMSTDTTNYIANGTEEPKPTCKCGQISEPYEPDPPTMPERHDWWAT